jgi:rhamnose transport system ATP-binding protein
VALASPADALRHRIAYVPEDRRRHGVLLDMSLAANTSMAVLPSVSTRGLIDQDKERKLAEDYIERLRIKASSPSATVDTLSGGNQQKVSLARWLATDPALLILDEPTQGVDVASKAEIHGFMHALAERGVAVLMISSELPEILGMSDRIAVMHLGTINGVLAGGEATPESVLALALERAAPVNVGRSSSHERGAGAQ